MKCADRACKADCKSSSVIKWPIQNHTNLNLVCEGAPQALPCAWITSNLLLRRRIDYAQHNAVLPSPIQNRRSNTQANARASLHDAF